MKLSFTKMEGCGNDYIYIDGFTQQIAAADKPALARKLSDRHFGIGGDGVIFVNPAKGADCEMEMYNADGSRGEMCGNGIRCVARFLYERGMAGDRDLVIESFGIPHNVQLESTDPAHFMVKVDMGAPVLEPAGIPVDRRFLMQEKEQEADVAAPVIDAPFSAGGQKFRVTCVSMGNPHAVVFVDSTEALALEQIGPQFEYHPAFPARVNTEFVQVLSRDRVRMRVWERGSGETLACGTGCCAVLTACVLNGKTEDTVTVEVRGGELKARWDREQNKIWMSGPAVSVFEGTVEV